MLMLGIKRLAETTKGTLGLVVMVEVDIFIDGLVLGIGFAAGAKQGFLLTVALTTEVLFLDFRSQASCRNRFATGEGSRDRRWPGGTLADRRRRRHSGQPSSEFLDRGILFVRFDRAAIPRHRRASGGSTFGSGKAGGNQSVLRGFSAHPAARRTSRLEALRSTTESATFRGRYRADPPSSRLAHQGRVGKSLGVVSGCSAPVSTGGTSAFFSSLPGRLHRVGLA